MKKTHQATRCKCPHCGKLIGDQPERDVSVEEAAHILGLARKTVQKLVSQRRIASRKMSESRTSKVLISLSALDAYRASLVVRPAL